MGNVPFSPRTAHLGYQHLFERLLRKYGRQNPEIRRNYYLEDTVEEGNFVSRERLLGCACAAAVVVPLDRLFVGIDWARRSDYTWVTVVNHQNDVIDWFKVPHWPCITPKTYRMRRTTRRTPLPWHSSQRRGGHRGYRHPVGISLAAAMRWDILRK